MKYDFRDVVELILRTDLAYTHPYYSFFTELTKTLKPKTVVELGTWRGYSARSFALGSADTKVITIDHHTDPGDRENQKELFGILEAFPNIKYCQGWTCTKLYEEEKDKHSLPAENAFPKVINELNGDTIDILFIDSWHRYDQAMKDWDAYKPLLSEESLVICDDILEGTKGSGIEDMRRFWDELEGDKYLDTTLHPGYPMGFLKP